MYLKKKKTKAGWHLVHEEGAYSSY